MRVERRFISGGEVRADLTQALGAPFIEGYAAVFNKDYVLYEDSAYLVKETIAPGAFMSVMQNDVRCLFNHTPDHVLGRTSNDTLTMREDATGLFYTNLMNTETRIGKDVYLFVKRGDVTGCSFAFIVDESEWTEVEVNGRTEITRTIKKLSRLYDVGPVTYPAYDETTVDARELRSADVIPAEILERIKAGKPVQTLGQAQPVIAAHTDALIEGTKV
jgi:HK97 family phage prohead protease